MGFLIILEMEKFPKRLFWDVDPSTLDIDKHASFIIQRVTQRGDIRDWNSLKKLYSIKKIRQTLQKARYLDPKTLSFFMVYFELDKKDFRCYTTQPSSQTPWSY